MNEFKNKVAQISLEVGGSHYPAVNTELQEQMVKTVLDQCLEAIEQCQYNHVVTSFDLAQHQATLDQVKSAIQHKFGLT